MWHTVCDIHYVTYYIGIIYVHTRWTSTWAKNAVKETVHVILTPKRTIYFLPSQWAIVLRKWLNSNRKPKWAILGFGSRELSLSQLFGPFWDPSRTSIPYIILCMPESYSELIRVCFRMHFFQINTCNASYINIKSRMYKDT